MFFSSLSKFFFAIIIPSLYLSAATEEFLPRKTSSPLRSQQEEKKEQEQEQEKALQIMLDGSSFLSEKEKMYVQATRARTKKILDTLDSIRRSEIAHNNHLQQSPYALEGAVERNLRKKIDGLNHQLQEKPLSRSDSIKLKRLRSELEEALYVHGNLEKLKFRERELSRSIEVETQMPFPDPYKLESFRRELEGLDEEGLRTKTAIALMEHDMEKHLDDIKRNRELKIYRKVAWLVKLKETAKKSLGHFIRDLELRKGIKKAFSVSKDQFSSRELKDLLTGPDPLIGRDIHYKHKISLLQRLSSLPSNLRKGLISAAKQHIGPHTTPYERFDILKEFSQFKSEKEACQFSFEFRTELSDMETPSLLRNAARAWRAGPNKFLTNLRATQGLIIPVFYKTFIENFYRLAFPVQEKFLELLLESPRSERGVLLIASRMDLNPFDPQLVQHLKDRREISALQNEYAVHIIENVENILRLKKTHPEEFQAEMNELTRLNMRGGFDWEKARNTKKKMIRRDLIGPVLEDLKEERRARTLERLQPFFPLKEWDKQIGELSQIPNPLERASAIRQARAAHQEIMKKRVEQDLEGSPPPSKEIVKEAVEEQLGDINLLQKHHFAEERKARSGLLNQESLEDDVFEPETTFSSRSEKDSDYESDETSPIPPPLSKTEKKSPSSLKHLFTRRFFLSSAKV
jgi:hypothetical protein